MCSGCTCSAQHTIRNSYEGVSSEDKDFGFLLNSPVALSERVKAKLISYFSSIHCIWKILLVCKYKQYSISQLILTVKEVVFRTRENHAEVTSQILVGCPGLIATFHSSMNSSPIFAQEIMRLFDTSFNILCSSSLASTTRSLSLLSTTKISPCVFWK